LSIVLIILIKIDEQKPEGDVCCTDFALEDAMQAVQASGLDGVVAADTVMSMVDGAGGRLVVRGHELRDLADRGWGLEDVAALLWDGFAENDADAVRALLGRARQMAWTNVPVLLAASQGLTVVEALRAGLGLLPDQAELPPHIRAIGALTVFTPALLRHAAGKATVAPDATRCTAADLLAMLHGKAPGTPETAALDTYLLTVADHGLNASTFAARTIASTRAGLISALIGGLCALKGPLHGGAPGPVLDMLDAVGSADLARAWVEAALTQGERLMGFGHRVYRVRDPRADVLKAAVLKLGPARGRIALAEAVEQAALTVLAERYPNRRLDTNVEFYTALLLEAVGVPREAFTAIFALGRAVGWTAHVLEQEATGRLIRPESRYIGPTPVSLAKAS